MSPKNAVTYDKKLSKQIAHLTDALESCEQIVENLKKENEFLKETKRLVESIYIPTKEKRNKREP